MIARGHFVGHVGQIVDPQKSAPANICRSFHQFPYIYNFIDGISKKNGNMTHNNLEPAWALTFVWVKQEI